MISSKSKSLKSQNKQLQRRKELREKYWKKEVIFFWRFIVFSFFSTTLFFLLLDKGWSPINSEQIKLKGNQSLDNNDIIQASGIKFPEELIRIDPFQIEKNLLSNLPLRAAKVRRRLLPIILEIEVLEKQPVAFATKSIKGGSEKGFLDQSGYWIPIQTTNQLKPARESLLVNGWEESQRIWIALIMSNQERLGIKLKKIILTSTGEINLQTTKFKFVYLGKNRGKLEEQMNALKDLSQNLPPELQDIEGKSLDIRDPSKPEIQMP